MIPFSSEVILSQDFKLYRKNSDFPFIVEENSLCYIQENESGANTKIWICSAFSIEKVILNRETNVFTYELNISTCFGDRIVLIDKKNFTKYRIDKLTEYGFSYDPNYIDLILKYVGINELKAETVEQYSHIGWYDKKRFLGFDNGYIGFADLEEKISVSNYLEKLNELIGKSLGCQLAVAIGLSSALFALLEDELHTGTPIFHFFGDTSCGKTTALFLIASMWGNPEEGHGLMNSWNATDNAMLSELSQNFGVTICFDEAGIVRRRDYTNLIYCISQGIDRARLTKACKQKTPKLWNTVVVSLGENSLLDASAQNTGLRARVIEFLDFPITVSAQHSEDIKSFCGANYGVMGRIWTKYLTKTDVNDLISRHSQHYKEILDELNTDKNIVHRLACVFSILILTAELLRNELKLNLNVYEIKNHLIKHLADIGRESLSLSQRAYNTILEWTNKNLYRIQGFKSPELLSAVAKFTSENEIAIQSSEFEKILFDNGFSDVRVVAKALKKDNLLRPESKDGLQTRIVFGNVRVPCYRIVFREEDYKETEDKHYDKFELEDEPVEIDLDY